jgi:hypothetical protein
MILQTQSSQNRYALSSFRGRYGGHAEKYDGQDY